MSKKLTSTARLIQWFNPGELMTRLNDVSNMACLLDTTVILLAGISENLNKFFYTGIGAIIFGILDAALALLSFIPNFVTCQWKMDNAIDQKIIVYQKKSDVLFHAIELNKLDDEKRQQIIKIKEFQVQLLTENKEYKEGEKYSSCDKFGYTMYVLIQFMTGTVSAVQAAMQDENDPNPTFASINKWVSYFSSFIYLIYMCSVLKPKHHSSHTIDSENSEEIDQIPVSDDYRALSDCSGIQMSHR